MQSSYSQQLQSQSDLEIEKLKKQQSGVESFWASGQWSESEKIRYIAFIYFNRQLLSSKLLRRTSKIFKQMSAFVRSRSPSQCRSQNQKVYKRFKTINRIVSAFRQEIGCQRFDQAYSELSTDPSIKFHTERDQKRIKSIQENQLVLPATFEIGVQTSTEGIIVMMSLEEYLQWNIFKSMNYSLIGCLPQTQQSLKDL